MSEGLISTPVSIGELIDKITILDIKSERITDPAKLKNVRFELDQLRALRTTLPALDQFAQEERGLKEVNMELWDVEDDLRAHEMAGTFGEDFVALARSVYKLNDRRAALKYAINQISGSTLVEEKSYVG